MSGLTELVCPHFYVAEWTAEGRRYTDIPGIELEHAADDGVCRLLHVVRDPATKVPILNDAGQMVLVCRCGWRFPKDAAQHIEVVS